MINDHDHLLQDLVRVLVFDLDEAIAVVDIPRERTNLYLDTCRPLQ